jgi:peroxiredoxin
MANFVRAEELLEELRDKSFDAAKVRLIVLRVVPVALSPSCSALQCLGVTVCLQALYSAVKAWTYSAIGQQLVW